MKPVIVITVHRRYHELAALLHRVVRPPGRARD